MRRSPDIDGRRMEDLRDHLESIAPYYEPDWDPDGADPGSALVAAFAEIAGDVLTRLDRVPEKQFVSFLDTLGVRRTPPHPSRLPLQVTVADAAAENVAVAAGTQAVAEQTDERPEQVFEVGADDGFEATPANVTHLYSVDPDTDAIYDHWGPLTGGDHAELFDGPNQQEHVLYIGDADLLTLAAGSTVRVTVETNAPEHALRDCFVWEFYGELDTDGEPTTDWQSLHSPTDTPSGSCELSEIRPVEEFIDDYRDRFRAEGYDLGDHPPGVRSRILARFAASVSEPAVREAPSGADQPLPPTLVPPGAFDQEVTTELRRELSELRDTLRAVSETVTDGRQERPTSTVTISFDLPAPTAECTVAGVTSRWLRCRLPDGELARSIFDIELRNVSLEVGTQGEHERGGLPPDTLLANDVPLPVGDEDGDLYPFGPIPQLRTTFYVASAEAFTKPGTTVELQFESPTSADAVGSGAAVDVSWEYWNGSGWMRLPRLVDDTADLTGPGAVRFDVPHDLRPRRVAGHDGHWVRARLVAGDYGRGRYEETSDGSWERTTRDVTPPQFGGVTIRYAQADAPAHLLPYNNLAFGGEVTDGATVPFRPFSGLPDASQTLYVGFDTPLRGGPIQLYVPLVESERPGGFDPRLRWECCHAAAPGTWSRLAVTDGTSELRQSGIVSLVFPEQTTTTDRFGEVRHWLRARVTATQFTAPAVPLLEPRLKRAITTPRNIPEPHRPLLRTERSAHVLVARPPALENLYVNTGWAYNRRTVDAEVLGSSEGSRTQQFTLATPPATSDPVTVMVDELATLSAEQRREFLETRPAAVEAVTGPDGDLREFWVEWTEVVDFLGSGPDARHYTLDRAAGLVTFGDGTHGKVPPRGRHNVRATYRTGGGTDGNVPANAVTGLKRSIPFVESVTNPDTAAGGADAESTDRVLRRAPKRLRDRDRAVYAADFERIAVDAAGELARAKCIPGMNESGDRIAGSVTVVVPDERETRPVPSAALKRQVTAALRARAPATVVDSERGGLAVLGPSFVDVSVAATIEATVVGSLSALEDDIARRLTAFLHPLAGGPTADGWAFGTVPHRSDLYAMLEGIDGVDHVVDLVVTFRTEDDEITVTAGGRSPRVSPDTLVFSGPHDITAVGGQ